MISVPTIFKNVVDLIRDNGVYSDEAPYFYFGHHAYISNLLTSKGKANAASYPLIALILDLEQNMYPQNLRIDNIINPTLILANPTNKDWAPEERETNNFKGILYPLYEDLLLWIYKSFYFNIQSKDIPHKRTDLYFYDSAEGHNKWNKYVDAIELRFSNLEICKQLNC